MTIHAPRDYQLRLENGVYAAWQGGARNVAVQLSTGAGKTFVFARVAAAANTAVCAIAHRHELVGQMSVALAREGVRHKVIGPDTVRRSCVSLHMAEFGRSFYDPGARVAVAGVDTLVNHDRKDPWLAQVGLWIQDECHHVLADNKWGKACALFPNARGLGVTATPVRADGKGLGRHADGLMDALIVGPPMRDLIRAGFLSDYRIFAPRSDIDLSAVTVGDGGDYSAPKLKAARQRSRITGDVVKHYLRIAPGKLGVTFDTDVESATGTAEAYRAAGVPAEVVTSKTPDVARASVLRRFRSREVLQLVNVDLFGEGFDLPAIEVVSMARPTQSYSLFAQQFGRALRPMDGKHHAIIIDHVGNVEERHGVPDAPRTWSLDRRERRRAGAPTDVVPVTACLNPECMGVYERVLTACPYCGAVRPIADRSTPERVDGDLTELNADVLARLRGEIRHVDGPALIPRNVDYPVGLAIRKHHVERQRAQAELRASIALWAGWQRALGRADPESYRRFWFRYGTDVATAQTLGEREALALNERIVADLAIHNVTQ